MIKNELSMWNRHSKMARITLWSVARLERRQIQHEQQVTFRPAFEISLACQLVTRSMSLPISAEIHRRPALHCQTGNHMNLIAIANPAMVFAPACLLRIAKQVRPGDMMMVPGLG